MLIGWATTAQGRPTFASDQRSGSPVVSIDSTGSLLNAIELETVVEGEISTLMSRYDLRTQTDKNVFSLA